MFKHLLQTALKELGDITDWCLANETSINMDMNGFVFVVWLTDERLLALFPAGTIVRDPHHRESPTRREQDLNLRRT